MSIKSVNPYDFSLNAELEEYSGEKINSIMHQASASWDVWKQTSFKEREVLFLKCAEVLLRQKSELAHTIAIEMGKPIKEGEAEIEKCASVCNYYAARAAEILKDEVIVTEAKKSFVTFQPLGCILAVMPWNFPFWQVFRFAVPALMAGNVGLLKHASNVPLCSLAIQQVFKDSGFPEGIFQSLLIASSKIPSLISNTIIKAVSLTGSEKAGSEVAGQAAKYIKKAVLELGGSDPFIVLEDADIGLAAHMAVKSRMINNGQSCIAAKRFIVHASVYEEFLNRMTKNMQALKIGDPLLRETDVGPMAREDLLDEMLEKLTKNIALGAKIILGGNKININGVFMEPTIITNVVRGMPAYHEELFGPIATVFKVSSIDEAIFIANDTPFGLGASIWTTNPEGAIPIAKKIDAGNVFINSIVASDPRLPFGGIKTSGYGRELSTYGIKEFVNIKTIQLVE